VALDPAGCATGWGYWPFIRRQIAADGTIPQLALYHCTGPATTTGAQLVRVAETRWAIEECLPLARVIAGSHWRRRRQHQARACHYHRCGHPLPPRRCSSKRWTISKKRNHGVEAHPRGKLDPSHIIEVGMGFWASRTLLSAVELQLFTRLGAEARTGEQIGERLGLHPE
jgi:hypothetical protein